MKTASESSQRPNAESALAGQADQPLLTEADQAWIAARVREEQFRLIVAQSTTSAPASVVIAMLMWGYLYFQLGSPSILVWAAATHLIQYVRIVGVRYHMFDPASGSIRVEWGRLYLSSIALSATLWALIPWLYFDQVDGIAKAFMMLMLLGMYSGALLWLSSVRGATLLLSIPMFVSIVITLLLQDQWTYRLGGFVSILYLVSSWNVSEHYHRTLKQSLMVQFEKQILVQRLNEQIALVKQASEEKSRFLAAASHDLRQPLQAIAMFGAVLERELAGSPQHVHAERSQRAIRALGDSLDAMLDISRLDAGVVETRLTAVPLNRLFQKINEVYGPQAIETGLHLRFRATPIWVHSDALLLDRMLSNLVSNALKYTRQGGVLVAARLRNGQVALEVVDTGVGIPASQRQKIFDEFYQLNNPGRDRSKGMGMGLAIVKRLSRLLGHRVEVTSRIGKGSRFRIWLTRAQPGESLYQFEGAVSGRFKPIEQLPNRVLLLDDEIGIREAMTALLATYGVEVTAVATPAQAFEALKQASQQQAFGAFLCDFRLADGEDGIDFALSLSARLIQLPPILVITGETAPDKLQRIRAAGIEVLFKPVSEKTLLQALMRYGKPANTP